MNRTYAMLLGHWNRGRQDLIGRGSGHHLNWNVMHACWGDLLMRRDREAKYSRGDRWGRGLGVSWHLDLECLKSGIV